MSVDGVSGVEAIEPEGDFMVESVSNENIRPMLARAVVDSGWGLREMRSKDLSLEEVFIQLVTEEKADNS